MRLAAAEQVAQTAAGRYRMQTRKKQTRNRVRMRGAGLLTRLFAVVVIAALVTFGITLFFRVETIQISGLEHIQAQQVLDASGLQYGDSMLLVNKSQIASRLKVQLPYIQEVRIHRQLPGTIRLELTEAMPVAVVVSDTGEYWLMSRDGTLLEQIPASQTEGYMMISGLSVLSPDAGQMPELAEEDSQKLSAMLELVSALSELELDPPVTGIDLGELFDIDLYCSDRFQIRLGSMTDLDYKLRYLCSAVEQLSADQSGIIDLTFGTDRVARFIPW